MSLIKKSRHDLHQGGNFEALYADLVERWNATCNVLLDLGIVIYSTSADQFDNPLWEWEYRVTGLKSSQVFETEALALRDVLIQLIPLDVNLK